RPGLGGGGRDRLARLLGQPRFGSIPVESGREVEGLLDRRLWRAGEAGEKAGGAGAVVVVGSAGGHRGEDVLGALVILCLEERFALPEAEAVRLVLGGDVVHAAGPGLRRAFVVLLVVVEHADLEGGVVGPGRGWVLADQAGVGGGGLVEAVVGL